MCVGTNNEQDLYISTLVMLLYIVTCIYPLILNPEMTSCHLQVHVQRCTLPLGGVVYRWSAMYSDRALHNSLANSLGCAGLVSLPHHTAGR